MMDCLELALQLLPQRYLDRTQRDMLSGAEELRLRVGQPLTMLRLGREYPVPGDAIRREELLRALEKATGASLHSAAPALTRGYIDYRGLRVGVCGSAAIRDGQLVGFRSVSSLALRIARECRGCCEAVWQRIQRDGFNNLLIISPPGGGKTTALREIVRLLSSSGRRVGLVDERGEVAAMDAGQPGYALGGHCDVISGVPKAAGSMMLLRGMNPQVIAVDEITQAEDLEAMREIAGCGVQLLATAHARDIEDLRRRALYRRMVDERLFTEFVSICADETGRSYQWRRLGS